MGIEYLDKTHAKLIATSGSGIYRKRKVKRITYTSKKDAERQYREFMRTVDFGIDSNMTVSRLLDWYIQNFIDGGGKETTIRGYKTAAKGLDKYLGNKKAADITLNQIEACIAKQRDLSPKTVKNRISLLRSAYKAAIRRGLLNYNPCEYALIPKQKKPETNILSEEDIPKFLEALNSASLDFRVACELALFCGLRRSELFGLCKADVSDTVTVNKTRHRINGKDIIQPPKTKTSERVLAVPKFIQEDITLLIKDQQSRPQQSEFLLLNGFGEPVHHSWANKNLSSLIKDFDLPHITMHGLRHTYASMLINDGVPIAEVSHQLGHASIEITLRTYTHLFSEASTASRRISDHLDKKWHQNGHQDKEKDHEPVESSQSKMAERGGFEPRSSV